MDIFLYNCVYIPVHIGNHWLLVEVNASKRMVAIYDSMKNKANVQRDKVVELIN